MSWMDSHGLEGVGKVDWGAVRPRILATRCRDWWREPIYAAEA